MNKLKSSKSPPDSDTESTSSAAPRKHSNGAPNLGDVLKDLGKVKLKSVERSPNGTPVRPPPNPATPVDAASLIAAALKKRFNANYRMDSPEKPSRSRNTSRNNNDEGDPFDETPPPAPNFRAKLRAVPEKKRRSS